MINSKSETDGILADAKIAGFDLGKGPSSSVVLLIKVDGDKRRVVEVANGDDIDFELIKKSIGKPVRLKTKTELELI